MHRPSSPLGNFKALALFVICSSTLLFLIFWLWQRQPKTIIRSIGGKTSQDQDQKAQNLVQDPFSPKNCSVLFEAKSTLKGKVAPNSYLAIFSNDYHSITKSDDSGSFEVELVLSKGLNLFDVVVVSQEVKEIEKRSLQFYYSSEKTDANCAFAGSVKSIFDNLLTVTLPTGDVKITIQNSTQTQIPEDEEESTRTAASQIRIGDYVTSLGKTSDFQSQLSQNLTVSRTDKPKNNKQITIVKTLTKVNKNILPVKILKDEKITDFTLSKDTEVQINQASAKTQDIVPDKFAIIIFEQSSQKSIADFVYILPEKP